MTNNHASQSCQPFFNLKHQKLLRGAVNSATTQMLGTGLAEAVTTLLSLILEVIRDRALSDLPQLESLDPRKLAQNALQKVTAIPELAEPSADLAELRQRHETLINLRSRRATPGTREYATALDESVGSAFRDLRQGIEQVVGVSPFGVLQLIDYVQDSVESVSIPEANPDPFQQFGCLVRVLKEIQNHPLSLPSKSQSYITEQLSKRSQPTYSNALQEIVQDHTNDLFRKCITDLVPFLEEQRQIHATFLKSCDDLRTATEERLTHARNRVQASRASVVIELPGPDEGSILSGLLSRQQCGDRRELALTLLPKWTERLRELASEGRYSWIPSSASLTTLLRSIDLDDCVDALQKVVQESLGQGHTPYEIVRDYGAAALAGELWQRAEPLCSLNSRDIQQFNILPTRHAIVRLPLPSGPQDAEIRQTLIGAFEECGSCAFLDTAPSERQAITVSRVILGFPIGIEESNFEMLMNYLRCEDLGHLPHLIGIPGSTLGEPIPCYVSLAKEVKHSQMEGLCHE